MQRILSTLNGLKKKKQQILVIENRFKTLEFFKNTLSKQYDLLIAQDKEEGLNRARINKPAMIILNNKLHKEGTLSLCADLREIHETKNIPILMIAERADDSTIKEFYEHKIEGFLIEPFVKQEILVEIKLAFNKRNNSNG